MVSHLFYNLLPLPQPAFYPMRIFCFLFSLFAVNVALLAQATVLDSCWNRLVKPLGQRHMLFTFEESLNELHHSFEPWQQTSYKGKGPGSIGRTSLSKWDTIAGPNGRKLTSRTTVSDSMLLLMEHGDKEMRQVTIGMRFDHFILTARYSPVMLLNHFHKLKIAPVDNDSLSVY